MQRLIGLRVDARISDDRELLIGFARRQQIGPDVQIHAVFIADFLLLVIIAVEGKKLQSFECDLAHAVWCNADVGCAGGCLRVSKGKGRIIKKKAYQCGRLSQESA